MSFSDRLNEQYEATPASRRDRPPLHVDLEAGVATFDAKPGEAMDAALARLIRDMWPDADDRTLQILDVLEVTFWGNPDNPMKRFRAKVQQPAPGSRDDGDFARLLKHASRARPRKPADVTTGGATFVVGIADWQAGQRRGGGTDALVERVHGMRHAMERRVRSLRRDGVQVDQIALLCLGDLVEGCDGHYAMQTAGTEHMRRQTQLVRRLLHGIVDHASGLAGQVLLAAVPGNHGEKRKDGKAFTAWDDNLDVEIPEQVGDILAGNPDRWGHVSVQLPTGPDLTLTLDLSGTRVGMAHGHQFKGGGAVQQKVDRWWAHKAKHRHLIGDADMLLSGHYHHLQVWEEGTHDDGTRTWIQCPSLDGGSDWWEHLGGAPTRQGTLTFVTSAGTWDRLEVLR